MNPHVTAAAKRAMQNLRAPKNERGLSNSLLAVSQSHLRQLGHDPISLLLKDAHTKLGHTPIGDTQNPTYVPNPSASMIEISMNENVDLPSTNSNVLSDMYFSREELKLAVAKASSYLRSGVTLAVIPDKYADDIVFSRHSFATVTPLTLETVLDGAELTAVGSPIKFDEFKFAETSSEGVQFKITRAQSHNTPVLHLHSMIYKSLVEAIAHKIDATIAAKIVASTPVAFTLAAAASNKLKTSDIKGITDGTSTKAAMVEGDLFLNGFNAELSAASGSYLIAPKFWAVAIPEKLRLLVQRELNGDYLFTLWTDLEALSTADSLAWSVA